MHQRMIISVKNSKMKRLLLDAAAFLAGSLLFAFSVNTFTAPNNIAAGGLTGAATMLNFLFDLPIGIITLILNLPLFIWGFYAVGFKFLAKTAVATVLSSLMIDITAPFMPQYTDNIFIVIIVGGLLSGLGLALIFMRGGTTGGTDLAASLVTRHFRHISIGKMLLAIDFIIVLASAFVYKNIESPFYAVVVIFICTKVIDAVLYGTDSGTGKMMFIISEKNEEISKRIIIDLDRGVTALKSRGCFSGRENETLLCGVRRHEVYKIYDIVYSIDESAFVMVGDAGEIRGEGFKLIHHHKSKRKIDK